MDAQEWSGLTRLGGAFERLRPRLVVFHNELGRELFDLPNAPRPDPDTPSPVRFLPQFDNVMLGHADRTRIVSDDVRQRFWTPDTWIAPFLVDGMAAGSWRVEGKAKAASLVLEVYVPLSRSQRDEVAEEGRALLSFLRPGAAMREVHFASVG